MCFCLSLLAFFWLFRNLLPSPLRQRHNQFMTRTCNVCRGIYSHKALKSILRLKEDPLGNKMLITDPQPFGEGT
jgi:hypothetical protein